MFKESILCLCFCSAEYSLHVQYYCHPIYHPIPCTGGSRSGGGGGEGMCGSRNFCQGGQVSLTKKALTTFFFVCLFFLVLSIFNRSQMVNFKETHHFSRFQTGSNIFQGGGLTFSRGEGGGGVQLLIPYRNPYNLWFSRGGGVRTPCPPLRICTCRGSGQPGKSQVVYVSLEILLLTPPPPPSSLEKQLNPLNPITSRGGSEKPSVKHIDD